MHATNADGEEPPMDVFGSLLRCNGGILTSKGVRYRIEVQEVEGPTDQSDKIDYVFARMKKIEEDEQTLQLSKPLVEGYSRAISKIGVRFDAPSWNQDKTTEATCRELGRSMGNFHWLPGKENSPPNRSLYMAYLRNSSNICLPDGSKLFDGTEAGELLSVEFTSMGVKTKGNIDVVMCAERHQTVRTTRSNMWAGIELKKQDNKKDGEITRQVVLQHLAASFLNEGTGMLTIMTDLGTRWRFYWFSKGQDALMEYNASSIGEANYLIRHMNDTVAASAPTDFLNRASWSQMFPVGTSDTIIEEGGHRNNGDGDNGGNDDDSRRPNNPKKKRGNPKSDGRQQTHGSSGGGGGIHGTAVSTLHNLDFMDEEEEKEVRFREVVESVLPKLGFFPPHQDGHSSDIPRQIELS